MPLPESVRVLLLMARRRLVTMDLLRRLVAAIGIVGGLGAILFGVGRRVPMAWAEPLVIAVGIAAVVAVVGWTIVRRPSSRRVAIEIDQRLGGKDQVSTTVELAAAESVGPVARAQIARTTSWAEARSLDGFGPVWPRLRPVMLTLLAVIAAAALAIPRSPADAVLDERRQLADLVGAEADALDAAADDIASEEVADRLREIADELRDAKTLEEALRDLGDARQELNDAQDPEALALKTARAGLEEKLRQEPLGEGATADAQLQDLADQARGANPEQLQELADANAADLAELADQVEGASPELGDALDNAAAALQRGDGAAAADALERALDELQRMDGSVGQSDALAQAQGEVRDAQRRLADAGQGEGQGEGEGQGQGEGEGQGQGQGEGQGQGQGQGGQGGGGGGSGSGADNQGPVTGGQGSGLRPGQGTGFDPDAPVDPGRSEVFDPSGFNQGDEERVDFDASDPSGDPLGRTEGEGIANESVLPYTDRYAEYQQNALGALDRMMVPPSLEDIVRRYFTELTP